MLDTAQKIISSILLLNALYVFIVLFTIKIQKAKPVICIFVVFIFMYIWRSFVFLSSSRYCSSFILLFFLIIAIQFGSTKKHFRKFHLILIVSLILYNLFETMISDSNMYILDACDDVNTISLQTEKNKIGILDKEFKRLRAYNQLYSSNRIVSLETFDSICDLYFQNKLWGYQSYCFIKGNNALTTSLKSIFLPDGLNCQIIRRYVTRSHKNNYLYLIKFNRYEPRIIDSKDSEIYGRLIAYCPQYDVYISANDTILYWYIPKNIDKDIYALFFLNTPRVDLLPEHRVKHQFDNRCFKFLPNNQFKVLDNYIIYSIPIPQEYPISYIRVGLGLTKDNTTLWITKCTI